MSPCQVRVCVAAWAIAFVPCVAPAALPTSAVPLFDGRSFAGWEGDLGNVWRIDDGQIVAGSLDRKQEKNDFLCTTRRYGNFDLRLKIKLAGTEGFVNSGIQFRSARVPNDHEVSGYQADFGKGFDGALYDESRRNRILAQPTAEVLAKVTKPGEWHDYRIRAEGPRIQLWVNGIQTVDYTETEPRLPTDGVIALQIHGNAVAEVRFKDILIEELPPSATVAECQLRGGLPHFFAKVKTGGPVRVAYFGGSITSAAGWRVGSLGWLKKTFPQASFGEINAAIGGTGSDFGAFRVGQDVIAAKPDLVFIEFASNDGGFPPEQIQATMEGTVRQIRRADPATDICFVYTLTEPFLAELQAGALQRSAAAMEAVAEHYAIPSIHFGVEVARQAAAGTLVFKGPKPTPFDPAAVPMLFSTDGIHPLVETGHVLYTKVLTRSLESMAGAATPAASGPLPAPLRPDNWEAAKLVPVTESMLEGPWTVPETDPEGRPYRQPRPSIRKAESAGATLRFTLVIPDAPGVKARRTAISDMLGPGGGAVEIRVDGGPPKTVPRFDSFCTYWRPATLPIGDLAPGKHDVEVKLLAQAPDKVKILFEHNRPDIAKNPAKYAPNVWYVSSLMIFGEATPR